MKVEYWGHHIDVPEPNIVGPCYYCKGDIYDYELMKCPECGWMIHKDCERKCRLRDLKRFRQQEKLRRRVVKYGNHKDLDKYLKMRGT